MAHPTFPPRLPAGLKQAILNHLRYQLCRTPGQASAEQMFHACSLAVRDRMVDVLVGQDASPAKTVCYLSMEFLMGRMLTNNASSMGLQAELQAAVGELGHDFAAVAAAEPDAALGNGGLGRLAACFLDSLATLGHAAVGYGINYEYGLFRQEIVRGRQREKPDNWLKVQSPWLLEQAQDACIVPLYGHIEHAADRDGHYNPMWMGWSVLVGVPHDLLVPGYGGGNMVRLRLFSARASADFDMQIFNEGDYFQAVQQKIASETISKVLYPSDSVEAGKELRLIQEYFLVACAVRDMLRRHEDTPEGWQELAKSFAVQLNDTHPALTVAELMRVLVDEKALPWEQSWDIVRSICAYTNHTLLPEALEKWPVWLMEKVLPRHLQIIYEINRRFLEEVSARWPGDMGKLQQLSVIEEGHVRQVRMAHLAIVGSHAVNGVSELHSGLLANQLFPDFHALRPDTFTNVTNGVTPRRWLLQANPGLARLIGEAIGEKWITDLGQLRKLETLAGDSGFCAAVGAAKLANKRRLAAFIAERLNLAVNPEAMFDVQVKRIHEYKRQLLNLLGVVDAYLSLKDDGLAPPTPRVHVFAGKAAPGYRAAKQIIKLIHDVAATIRSDPAARDWLNVVFLPDYRVSLAEVIIPAADLSEQISTAGMEASGTGNMKFSINGALTVGTLDGANVEMREEIGADNFYLFGHTTPEIAALRCGGYDPQARYQNHPATRRALDALLGGRFGGEGQDTAELVNTLIYHDPFFVLADFPAYLDIQRRIGQDYLDTAAWQRKAVLNIARMGKFSSDRSIAEYAQHIWGVSTG